MNNKIFLVASVLIGISLTLIGNASSLIVPPSTNKIKNALINTSEVKFIRGLKRLALESQLGSSMAVAEFSTAKCSSEQSCISLMKKVSLREGLWYSGGLSGQGEYVYSGSPGAKNKNTPFVVLVVGASAKRHIKEAIATNCLRPNPYSVK